MHPTLSSVCPRSSMTLWTLWWISSERRPTTSLPSVKAAVTKRFLGPCSRCSKAMATSSGQNSFNPRLSTSQSLLKLKQPWTRFRKVTRCRSKIRTNLWKWTKSESLTCSWRVWRRRFKPKKCKRCRKVTWKTTTQSRWSLAKRKWADHRQSQKTKKVIRS